METSLGATTTEHAAEQSSRREQKSTYANVSPKTRAGRPGYFRRYPCSFNKAHSAHSYLLQLALTSDFAQQSATEHALEQSSRREQKFTYANVSSKTRAGRPGYFRHYPSVATGTDQQLYSTIGSDTLFTRNLYIVTTSRLDNKLLTSPSTNMNSFSMGTSY